jgi:hypothetical protein
MQQAGVGTLQTDLQHVVRDDGDSLDPIGPAAEKTGDSIDCRQVGSLSAPAPQTQGALQRELHVRRRDFSASTLREAGVIDEADSFVETERESPAVLADLPVTRHSGHDFQRPGIVLHETLEQLAQNVVGQDFQGVVAVRVERADVAGQGNA